MAACNPRPPAETSPGASSGLVADALAAPSTSSVSFALAGGDRAWIVWTETRDRDGALRTAQRDGGGWSAAVTLTSAGVIARPGAVPAAIVPHDGPLLALYASSIADGRGAARD